MKYLLDSNIVIAALLGIGDNIKRRMAACDVDDMAISAIVYAEVLFGSARGKPPQLLELQAFVEDVPVLAFDTAAADAYATLPFKRASYDRLIAAHALSRDLTLVTDNVAHFADIPDLRVENWTQ